MTDKEKIRVEIERLISRRDEKTFLGIEKISALKEVLSFIDSMQEESVSEELEDAAFDYAEAYKYEGGEKLLCVEHFKAGANWQKQQDEHLIWQLSSANYEKGIEEGKKQMIKDAFECKVKVDAGGYPYIPQMELYDYDKDIPLAKEGDRYKVVLIKDE